MTEYLVLSLAVLTSLPAAGLAVYRISKLLVDDFIFEKIRDKIFKKFPPESTKTGYFFTCYWCTSLWVATLVTIGFILVPSVMLIVCLPFAFSAIAGLLSER
jgi:hypothetical protein